MNKTRKIALLSIVLNLTKVLVGPITLYFISLKLTPEMIGFYYAFFGVIGLKMLFEAGMTNVVKVNYSHRMSDKNSLNHLFIFSFYWFLAISIILFIFLMLIGEVYFSSYTGGVDWRGPWIFLSATTSINIFLTFIDAYLDGTQKQIELKALQLLTNLNCIILWLALVFDYELYSLGIMQTFSILITLFLLVCKGNQYIIFEDVKKVNFSFKKEFQLLFPLLKKVFFVWMISYLFWNGYTLLAFKIASPDIAGKIGMTFSLAMAGYMIANSVINNQMTHISYLVSQNNINESLQVLYKYLLLSVIILISGYGMYFVIFHYIPGFIIFTKVMSGENTFYLFLFFIIINIFSTLNNYVRAFKIEPFVFLSLYNTISVMILFYYELKTDGIYFKMPAMAITLTMLISIFYFYKFVRAKK